MRHVVMEVKQMAFKSERKPFKIGNSRGIILPTSWCRYYTNRIDSVTIIEDQVLIIAPVGLEGKAQAMIDRYNEGGNGNG